MALPRNNNNLRATFTGRSNEERMDIETNSTNHKVKVGLLTHTLVSSPIIQWILPARLRGKYQNDVVFVGERSLQIKEAVSGTHLQEVTSKSDFDAYIMAAKVINVSTELPWEAQMKLGSSNAANNTDQQQDLPPQIMVLSLTSRELVFLYYSNTAGQFIHYHRPLPNDVSTFERFGRNIAVEPRSRAVAVSASCDYFGIFILKKPPILQSQMADHQLNPVAEERFFRVEGDIIFMEFLYPKSEEGDKIILLLLVSHDQLTHAICYEWNASQTLRQVHPRITKRLLPFEDRLPTMLIPLTKTSSFMLITTTSMTIYKNKLDPQTQPNRYPLPVPDREPQRSPLWTRWARPLRNWLYNQKHDDIYLCREDGRIFYLGIGNEGEVENQAHLGRLCCDVDAAFDILDIGHEGGDLLLAAGNTGDGGLFIQKARDHPRCVQKFMNWTPVTDSVVLKSLHSTPSTTNIGSDRLFVCSASSFGRGAVVELRHGIEAQIGLVISLEELSSTRDLWIMPDELSGGVYVLTSDPVSSTILYLPANFEEEISAVDEADCGLDLNAQTLAAGHTESGVLIQVTDRAILLGATAGSGSNFRFDLSPQENVAVAAVSGPSSLVATAVRVQQEMRLHVKAIKSVSNGEPRLSDIGQPAQISYEAVCMSIEIFDVGSFVFIGTGNGKILIYHVGDEITPLLESTLILGHDDDISKAIDSIAIVRQSNSRPCNKHTLLCGLRSGFLIPFELTINSGDGVASPIVLRQSAPQHLGHTSVKVQGRGNIALLTCGNGFWQDSCVQDGEVFDYTIQRIWITDQNNPAYYPRSIHSFALAISIDASINSLSSSLFCIADGQLIICTLDQGAKAIPRRINLPGSAHKLAYSKHLRSLIVAYTKTTFDTDTDPIKRFTRPYIEFVDPDLQHPMDGSHEGEEEDFTKPWRPQGAAGEKISCILEWTPRKGDEKYHFIVIGTSRRNQQDRGRVIFLQASRDSSTASSQIECSVKYIHKFDNPVYSIVPYGDFTLMVSTGHEIVALEPKISETRRIRAARYTVLSPAISMTVHEPYLYLSTSRESLLILQVSDDKLQLHAYDRQKHDGLSHIHIGGEMKLTLTSSRGGRVSLLTENGITENDKMMPAALCEAHLPSSVMRLTSSSRPSPLSSPSQVFYGTAMNGTVYRFLMLGEEEWRLLRLLQNLCIRDPVICPFTPKRRRQRNPVGHDPLEFQPSQMHIDGDILSRLVTRGSSYLMHMLVAEEYYNPSTLENGSAQATLERFDELAEDVLGESSHQVEAVMQWLKEIFHVEF